MLTAEKHHHRRDIDGLRALAISLVLVNHAFPKYCPGGFIGVDVFFVISGFLISGIILKGLRAGTFTFSDFYSRRVRRILPALLLVLISCYCIGLLDLFADEFSRLGKHIFAASAFISNFVFKNESGYWDVASTTKPLLHLWSLAVEEQFYLMWPMLLVFAWRRRISFLSCCLVVGGASFALNVLRLSRFPDEVFYLSHTRIWELLLGGCLVAISERISLMKLDLKKLEFAREISSITGIVLIFISAYTLNDKSLFPGINALSPVIGSFLIIFAGDNSKINRIIFGNSVMVWIGLISYPLYLWHWPLFSFVRIIENGNPSNFLIFAASVLSVILAWLTYRILETPIRRSQISISLVILLFIVGAVGYFTHLNEGKMTDRLVATAEAAKTLESGKLAANFISGDKCIIPKDVNAFWCASDIREKPKYILVGDSMVVSFFSGLVNQSKEGERWGYVGVGGFRFLLPLHFNDKIRDEKINKTLDLLAQHDAKMVVIIHNLNMWQDFGTDHEGTNHDEDRARSSRSNLEGSSAFIKLLEDQGKQVVFMVPTPGFTEFPEYCVIRRPIHLSNSKPVCEMSYKEYKEKSKNLWNMFVELQRRHPKLLIYDPIHLFCSDSTDTGVCGIFSSKGRSLFGNTTHLSDHGADLVAHDFLSWVHNRKYISAPWKMK